MPTDSEKIEQLRQLPDFLLNNLLNANKSKVFQMNY